VTFQSADLQLNLSGTWTSVPLLLDGGMKIERGVDPWGTWPRPTRVECRINNDSLNYDPSRPASLLYGVAGRNSRARVYSNSNARVWVEATTWEPDRTPEHVPGAARGLAWVDLTAYGMLNRLRTWEEPVRSPMFKTISGRSRCFGHWPLEDDRDTLRAVATIGQNAITRGVTFGESDAPAGAKQSARLSDTSFLNGRFKSAPTTGGWQIAFSFKLDQLPTTAPYVDIFSWRCANGMSWYWAVNNNSYQYRVNDADGVNLYTGSSLWGGDASPDVWITARLKATQSGGNVQLEPAWYSQNGTVWGITDTFAGLVSVPQQWYQFGSTTASNGHLSHVFAVTGTADNLLSTSALISFDGYNGELAYDRYFRVMAENGLQAYSIGNASDTPLMGPQPVDSVLNILADIRSTDGGRIDDERFDIAATLRTRRSLYNQTPVITLDYAAGEVAIPFRKLIDATPIKNIVTVKNRQGGELTASLTVGPASVQPPPAGVGTIPYTQNVNVYNEDTQLPDIASHWLQQLTQNAPRFEEVTVDLLAHPSLVNVLLAREGDLVRVINFDYDPIDLLVVGIREQVGPGALWSVTLQTEPGEFWRIGVYDDGVWRWDTRTMVLAGGGVTAGALSITTNVTDPNDVLTTAAGSYPLDLVIGQGDGTGEIVRATGATAAGAGPTYAQTITLSARAVNGVARAWPAGMDISVHDSRRWGT
jgi:hypothetical protein